MEPRHAQPALAILAPADQTTLAGISVSGALRGESADTRPTDVMTFLRAAAASADGRLAVAVGEGAEVVGYLFAEPPAPGTRLYAVPAAVELTAMEVAPGHRRRGAFTGMFSALFRRDLESSVVYVVADPVRRDPGESLRVFRDRIAAVLGSVGFMPTPTDEAELHPHPNTTLFVRVGRAVPASDVEDFYKRLRSFPYASVAIALRDPFLRNLLRDDLERNGYMVRSVFPAQAPKPADIVIADHDVGEGRELTVRLDRGLELHFQDGTLWFPSTQMDRLATIVRTEVDKRRAS